MTVFSSNDDVPSNPDVAIEASDRLKARRTAVARAVWLFKFLVFGAFILALLIIGGLVWWAYEHRVSGYVTDERSCSLEVGKRTLTGTRAYSYHFNDYLGWRFIDTRAVEEKTTVQVRGYAFTVVNLRADGHDVTRVGMGEQGVQILKPADKYIFMFDDGAVGVSDYRSLCK